jgi:hypothetical protein
LISRDPWANPSELNASLDNPPRPCPSAACPQAAIDAKNVTGGLDIYLNGRNAFGGSGPRKFFVSFLGRCRVF